MADNLSKVSIPKFNGFSTEDAEEFLQDFNAYCVLNQIKDNNKRKVAAFQLYLTGPAKIWFASLDDYDKRSWSAVESVFTSKFAAKTTSTFLTNSEKFQSLCLGPNDKLETFFSKLVDLAQKLDKSDMDILLKFVDCLPKKLAFYVRAGNPESAEEALNAAKIGESYGYRDGLEIEHAASPLVVGSVLERKLDELSRQVHDLHTRGAQTNTSQCHQCGGANHRQHTCNWMGGPKDPDVICQLCDQYGHSARNCAKHQRCQLCNRHGHVASECRSRLQGNGRTPSGRGRGRLGGNY